MPNLLLPAILLGCRLTEPTPPPAPDCAEITVTEAASVEDTLLADVAGEPVYVTAAGLRLQEGAVVLDVPYARLRLVPHGTYVDLDDVATYDVVIEAMRFRLDAQALATALPSKAPVDELTLSTDGEAFVVEGSASFLDLPMTLRAVPRATEAGRLELEMDKAKILGIGIVPVLDLLEGPLSEGPGLFVVEGEHLYLDPFARPGPPDVEGRFTHAAIVGDALVATLDDGEGEGVPEDVEGSWLVVEGGVLKSGGALLFGSRIRLVPEDAEYLTLSRGFEAQIRRGYAKQREGGLDLHVPPPGPDATDGVAEGDRVGDRR